MVSNPEKPTEPPKPVPSSSTNALVDLIGDHQMGTCRMGHDPNTSVLDANCRLHDCPNVLVVDTSFMPTGFGLNPDGHGRGERATRRYMDRSGISCWKGPEVSGPAGRTL